MSWRDPELATDDESRRHLVLAGYQLGAQRAEALGRGMRAIDVEYGLALLGEWPLKPETSAALPERMDEMRARIVAPASEGQWVDLEPNLLTSTPRDPRSALDRTDGA